MVEINKSAHFEFNEEKHTIRFIWGRGKSMQNHSLHFTPQFYPTAKRVFQEFLNETEQRRKISKLASALNLGSEDERITQLCFLLEVMWRYDFNKSS